MGQSTHIHLIGRLKSLYSVALHLVPDDMSLFKSKDTMGNKEWNLHGLPEIIRVF